MALLPREHGAYGQIVFPLATSFAVAGVTRASLLVAVVAAFLARAAAGADREARPSRAAVWLALAAAVAVGAGGGAWRMLPGAARWALLLPAVPAGVLAAAIAREREKSTAGEIAVALAFSFAAVPICLAAGAPAATALAVGVAFGAVFVTATLAVRGIVLCRRSPYHVQICGGRKTAVIP